MFVYRYRGWLTVECKKTEEQIIQDQGGMEEEDEMAHSDLTPLVVLAWWSTGTYSPGLPFFTLCFKREGE